MVLLSLAFLFAIPFHGQNSQAHAAADDHKSWETTIYASGGPAIDYVVMLGSVQADGLRYNQRLRIYAAGFGIGKMLTLSHGRGLLRGQTEYLMEFEPFWLGDFPAYTGTATFYQTGDPPSQGTIGTTAGNNHGVDVTPMLFRYRFTQNKHLTPYVQLGGGLLLTAHDFPAYKSSHINFTPQAGIGVHLRTREKQAIELGVNVVHISNADMGATDPGVQQSLIFRVGYTWWH